MSSTIIDNGFDINAQTFQLIFPLGASFKVVGGIFAPS
jgi:hypothetical protein